MISKFALNDSLSPVIMPLCNPSLWLRVEFSNLLLMNRIQQMGLAVTSEIKLQREHDFCESHFIHSHLLLLSLMKQLAAMPWTALWKGPWDKELRAVASQSPALKWGLSSTIAEEVNLPNNHSMNLADDASPVKLWLQPWPGPWLQPLKRLRATGPG